MGFYLINFIIFILYSSVIQISNSKHKRELLFGIYIMHFTAIAGCRSIAVGTDTRLYNNIFISTINTSLPELIRNSKFVGYSLWIKFIALLFNNSYESFLFISAFVTNMFLFYVVYKIKNLSLFYAAYLYITFYYFYQSMNIARQYLAIALCLVFFYWIVYEKKYYKGILFWLLAVSIHSTAIVCIVFIPLSKIKWNLKKYGYLSVFTILILFFYNRIFTIFQYFFHDYQIYNENQYSTLGTRILLVLFQLIILLFGLIITNKYKEKYTNDVYVLQSIILISTIIGMFYSNNELIVRMQIYFEIFSIIYIPLLFLKITPSKSKFSKFNLIFFGILLILLVPYFYQVSKNYGNIIPYTTFFRK